jgi:hypothetical protein
MWPEPNYENVIGFRSVSRTGAIRFSDDGAGCLGGFDCHFDFGMGAHRAVLWVKQTGDAQR